MSDVAIDRWRATLGDEHVSTEHAEATFPTTGRAIAWLRPADRAQVQACVRIAHACGVPLHPISRGKNWGYGSRTPPRDAAVLDLSRLDRIVDFDERLAYVTVEPGVTFRRLAAFLRTTRARVFASVTGGTADASVLANALERGDGAGPLGDRFGHACALEIVLPDGEVVHTGFARFPGATVGPLAKWGVGPYLDGLFSQATLGVVTRATFWLAPYPRRFVLAGWSLADDARLHAIVEALRALKLHGVTPATVPIWNDVKALSLVTQYPWHETSETPMSAPLRTALRSRFGLGRWNGTVSLYGASDAHADALRAIVAETLGPIADLRFRDGPDDPLDADEDLCGPALGVPHDRSAAAVYWRKRLPVPSPLDPDRDRCGFIWLSHAIPFDGAHARIASDLVERELDDAGFEPSLALLGIGDRALHALPSIAYDRDLEGEDERAMRCHDRLTARLVERGYPPFRRGVQSPAPAGEPRYEQLLEDLARAIDPHGVFVRR